MSGNGNLPATIGLDVFGDFAKSVVTGQYLTFSRYGEWVYGLDKIQLADGTKLAANILGMRRGWKRWENSECTEELMHPLVDRIPVPSRASLGDMDSAMWERDTEDKAIDPWSLTFELQMVDNAENAYTFSTRSQGGKNCLAKLSGQFYEQGRMHPNEAPIVALGRDSYDHKKWGKTYVPMLTIVDWQGEDVLTIGAPSTEVVEEDDIPFEVEANQAIEKARASIRADTLATQASAKPTGYDAVMAEREAQKAAALQASATPKPVKRARF